MKRFPRRVVRRGSMRRRFRAGRAPRGPGRWPQCSIRRKAAGRGILGGTSSWRRMSTILDRQASGNSRIVAKRVEARDDEGEREELRAFLSRAIGLHTQECGASLLGCTAGTRDVLNALRRSCISRGVPPPWWRGCLRGSRRLPCRPGHCRRRRGTRRIPRRTCRRERR